MKRLKEIMEKLELVVQIYPEILVDIDKFVIRFDVKKDSPYITFEKEK